MTSNVGTLVGIDDAILFSPFATKDSTSDKFVLDILSGLTKDPPEFTKDAFEFALFFVFGVGRLQGPTECLGYAFTNQFVSTPIDDLSLAAAPPSTNWFAPLQQNAPAPAFTLTVYGPDGNGKWKFEIAGSKRQWQYNIRAFVWGANLAYMAFSDTDYSKGLFFAACVLFNYISADYRAADITERLEFPIFVDIVQFKDVKLFMKQQIVSAIFNGVKLSNSIQFYEKLVTDERMSLLK